MDIEDPQVKGFMLELYSITGGDPDAQVSMYEVGESLGLEKTAASALAEDLIIQEWVELKTLSGGIGITGKGLEVLQVESPRPTQNSDLSLGKDPVLNETGTHSLQQVLAEIKEKLPSAKTRYEQLEETVIDIKTIETQLLSPKPKTAIIRETLLSIAHCLNECGMNTEADTIKNMTSG